MKDARSELIRIDGQGVAHPIGSVASQRMRAREGAYRLLPGPPHVVFMRFTGEDGRRDAEDGAIVRLAGEITGPGAMCDIFALLGQAGWRGELCVMEGEAVRSVFFDQGLVVGVRTNVEEERIGMVLYRFGVVTNEEHARILEAVKAGKRYGAAAVELGVLGQDQVFAHLGKQIEEVVFATLTVSDGTFFFLDGFDESRLVAKQTMSANGLLMDAVTRMDESRYFEERIPSSDYVPHRTGLSKSPEATYASTYDVVDGERSVEEVGRATGRGVFETTKDLYALVQSKHVLMKPPPMAGGREAIVQTANEALRVIHREADAAGYGAVLRANLSGFAVGAGMYDILFRGAGPDEQGMLDAERIANNVSLVAQGADATQVLRQMLHDYAGFALFSLGGMMGMPEESELNAKVEDHLHALRPGA